MANGQRVLVVDGLTETEEVLRAVLEPRGLRVNRVRGDQNDGRGRPADGRPHVVVIHEDGTPLDHARLERWGPVPRVVIGTADIPQNGHGSRSQHYLQKPFQYPELIDAIERLLSEPDCQSA